MKSILLSLSLLAGSAFANGELTPDLRVSSEALGYDLQYRVYLPEGYESKQDLAVMFVTDGPSYIRNGRVPQVLDKLISSDRIEQVIVVFVDARDPDHPEVNRRNSEFFCNSDYLKFYTDELIPRIEKEYPAARDREKRSIMGVSFGGLNAACFGLLGYQTFSGIAMHSPANHPVPELLSTYEEAPTLPLRIFLSTGRPNDNTQANRQFRRVLQDKGYQLEYIEQSKGHDWENWRPLIDDVLLYFYETDRELPAAR